MPPSSLTHLLDGARDATRTALRVGSQLPSRDNECDVGCAVATLNLAHLARVDGETDEARHLFAEARKLFVKFSITLGRDYADEMLRKLDAQSAGELSASKPPAASMLD